MNSGDFYSAESLVFGVDGLTQHVADKRKSTRFPVVFDASADFHIQVGVTYRSHATITHQGGDL